MFYIIPIQLVGKYENKYPLFVVFMYVAYLIYKLHINTLIITYKQL